MPAMNLRTKPSTLPVTARQAEYFRYIEAYIARYGFPPTMREIGDALGVRSTNTVDGTLVALERKGMIKREAQKTRSITIVGDPRQPPTEEETVARWRAENAALRRLLRRVLAASTRLGSPCLLSPELVVVLGDVRDVLATMEVG